MHKTINTFTHYRNRANLSLNDVAYLLNIDSGNLSKIEKGKRKPNATVILLYHILFDAPLTKLLPQELSNLKEQLVERSVILIDQLQIEQPPKSFNRIEYLRSIVNQLSHTKNEE